MSLRFLVVDDSVTMRRIVVNSLKNLGYDNFIEANDGKEALEKLAGDDSINFVITDWNMPVLSGLELTKNIRQDAKLAKFLYLWLQPAVLKKILLRLCRHALIIISLSLLLLIF